MGIDIYLKWEGMTDEDQKRQYTGMCTKSGHTGYLREAYHGGPYATKILCREAFEAEKCEAEIPAEILRERLTHVTEPVIGANGGHLVATMFSELMRSTGMGVEGQVLSDITTPMTVEEAVRERYQRLYPEESEESVNEVVESFREFVALAEQKEKETGKPCTIIASY
jgi:hypothetical protein